ncbi:phosphoenolpyruvate--protein phosphotransferase [Ahniella affigens]|nr:phosphoenolpyruvate--protein phosphotransferase [Ahniella affigens]
MSRVQLRAPCAGWLLPLSEVADAVFSTGLAGPGLAIEPLDDALYAPADGTVILMGAARHALTLRVAGGMDVLMHVGIDTVNLHGSGFECCVQDGQEVRQGDCLLRFDLDLIAREAPSTATPILLVSGGQIIDLPTPRPVQRGDALFAIESEPETAEKSVAANAIVATTARQCFRIPFEHGLHARPAAQLVSSLKSLQADVRVIHRGRDANARSAIALMSLGLVCQDEVEVLAEGPDAEAALQQLRHQLVPLAALTTPAETLPVAPAAQTDALLGIIAVRGLAVGVAYRLVEPELEVPARAGAITTELAVLAHSLATVAAAQTRTRARANGALAAILDAHAVLLTDPELQSRAEAEIRAGASAGAGWRLAVRHHVALLQGSHHALHAERAADLVDLERQVLRAMLGQDPMPDRPLPEQAIVIADELLPSQFAQLDLGRLAALAMARGGPSSHVALLAAARGVPTLMGLGSAVLQIEPGQALILDADRGALHRTPTDAECALARARLEAQRERDAVALREAAKPALTQDGVPVRVHANLGAADEAAPAAAHGADGCGLLRTEFLFLDRRAAPDEAEQTQEYTRIVQGLNGGMLTLRTLDVGGDKPLPYLPIAAEENPALGIRGLRFSLRHPDLLAVQFRAALKAAAAGPLRVMLPMVNDLSEFRTAKACFDACVAELNIAAPVSLGVMIETPAAAMLAEQLATEAAFLSIGSNDLSQYVLAMDRGHAALAGALDAMHPAVLRMISMVAKAGLAAGRSVSVCGGLAGDPEAVPVLLGLGVAELSVVPRQVPRIKQQARQLRLAECQQLAADVLSLPSADAVRRAVRHTLQGVSP